MTNIRYRIQEELVKPAPDDVDGMWALIDELEDKGWIYKDGQVKLSTDAYDYEQSITAYCALAWMGYHIGCRETEWCTRDEVEDGSLCPPWSISPIVEEDNGKYRFVYQNAEQALEKLEKDDD